ncbi:MAG: MOSC domain-containing protein [Acidimicrobiales bacterium]
MATDLHPSTDVLQAGLDHIRRSPADGGRVEQIVRRPAVDEREALSEARLDTTEGLVGDTWRQRTSSKMAYKSPHPDMQVTLMNARVAALVAGSEDRWQLAGDQLYVDLDLSRSNLPPGTRLAIGEAAVIEVTAEPHTGCKKFAGRFGMDSARFVNSPAGRELQLRGVNAKVVVSGAVRVGDAIRKV